MEELPETEEQDFVFGGGVGSMAGVVEGSRSSFQVGGQHAASGSRQTLSAFVGAWNLTFTNGVTDAYVISTEGVATLVSNNGTGRLQRMERGDPFGERARDRNYLDTFYLANTFGVNAWQYLWMENGVLKVDHFCEHYCEGTSPRGSPKYCCTGIGTKVDHVVPGSQLEFGLQATGRRSESYDVKGFGDMATRFAASGDKLSQAQQIAPTRGSASSSPRGSLWRNGGGAAGNEASVRSDSWSHNGVFGTLRQLLR